MFNSFIRRTQNIRPFSKFANALGVPLSGGDYGARVASRVNANSKQVLLRGYPAWIRTKNNASKGRCVTVTPRGMRFAILDSRFSIQAQCPKSERDWAYAEQLASKMEVESLAERRV